MKRLIGSDPASLGAGFVFLVKTRKEPHFTGRCSGKGGAYSTPTITEVALTMGSYRQALQSTKAEKT